MRYAFAIAVWTLLSGPVLYGSEHEDLLRDLKALNTPTCPCNHCTCETGVQCNHPLCPNQRMRWIWEDGSWWLYKGTTCIGATNSSGVFYPWTGSDWGPKTPPPVPVPIVRLSLVRGTDAPICHT